MRLLRSPAPGVTPVVLLVVLAGLAGLVGACSTDGDDAGDDAGATAGAEVAATDPTDEADPTDPSDDASTMSDSVAAVCVPFSRMVTAIKGAATEHSDPDQVAAAIAPVMKEFAALVPDLERPQGMSASTWRGIRALADRILELPERPTNAEVAAVERQLTPEQRAAIGVAADWFKTRCDL
ncbi:hypothetical protein [Nocardioides antri]|uniref:Uncharacterized protein n=1 Tax=Nocardioides antri TaxID=2607659 RepID=A0A5B1M7B3_9ACTN|nr:hypothetical protein [Nocardioides antri]KAA1427909.1 hypothetical protein F0U47_10890 [Nocardioides antri]